MPKTRFVPINPWNLFFMLGLLLGVCLFCPFSPNAFAIEPDSSFFQQNQNESSTKDKTGQQQSMALPEETPSPSPGVFSTILRLIFFLGLTIGLIFLTVWGLKFIWDKKGWNALGDESKPIRVLTSTFIAPRKTIQLVEIGKRILVVGVGNDEMSCLDVITDPEEVELLRQTALQGFPKIFNRILQKHEAVQEEEETQRIAEESRQVVGGFVDKLKKISKKKKADRGSAEGDL
jgi:flagellar biogenesis protein FliO